MKLVIQRVLESKVEFEDGTFNKIDKGLLVYLSVHKDDTILDLEKSCDKLVNLRVFEDEKGKLNLSIKNFNYEIMVISNFTLYGSFNKGNRPSFTKSANASFANEMYEKFLDNLRSKGIKVSNGKFQTYMKVESINDGPVNLIYDTQEVIKC